MQKVEPITPTYFNLKAPKQNQKYVSKMKPKKSFEEVLNEIREKQNNK